MKILRKHILMSILVWVAATSLMCLWFILNPTYSDETTTQVSGTVVSVETESRFTGYKGRKRGWIIITLDNGSKYDFAYSILNQIELDYKIFQNEITGRDVDIRCKFMKENDICYLEVEEKTILEYDVFNQVLKEHRIVVIIIYVLILIFFGAIIWLKYSLANK